MFVHLHVHSHYSLLDGLPKIPELVQKASELGMDAVALTDHGVLYGLIEFYKACKERDIKPILGMEAYLSPYSLQSARAKTDRTRYHLTLLAKNLTGYKNLLKLCSIGWLDGFYYKPRIDKASLKKYGEGIIVLSGCASGEINQALRVKGKDKARELIDRYQSLVGKENFYIEIQNYPSNPEYTAVRPLLIELANDLTVPLVATNDVHYLHLKDKVAQDVLLCIQMNKKLDDEKRVSMMEKDLHFAGEEEMQSKFSDIPEAIRNSERIAQDIHLELALGAWMFPSVEIPQNKSPDEYLAEEAAKGIKIRLGKERVPIHYHERIEYELAIIKTKGYAPYFLVVADIVAFCHSRAIITTTRGSAAGSLVSYAIGITTADPMDFELPFERFLNPYRPSPPDIDLDIEDARRAEVIAYVREKYGEDKVAHIVTFGTLLARAAVRDVGRVLNLPYSFCDKLAKMIPIGQQGFKMTLNRAMDENPQLKTAYDENEDVKRVVDIAREIEGCVRHQSLHAAGVVIAPTKLTDFTAIQKDPATNEVSTQYDMHAIEETGLLKMDLLGITNLSILGLARELIKKTRAVNIDLYNLPLDDKKTYDLLTSGKSMGVFQLSGDGMTRYLKELQPTTIFDIMALISLYRPGPMESIPEYIKRKRNPELVTYPHPKLEPILKKSYGIITYQDDVLLTAITLAGYDWEEADKLRKAIGKKIPKEMARQKSKFISGCIKQSNISAEEAGVIWRLIEPFAAYGFNKAHGSSYALLAYQTAYVKANYPLEYMAALLSCESGNMEKVAEGIRECENLGLSVLPPDVNESMSNFTVIPDKKTSGCHIRFGLNAIKHLGTNTISDIIAEREAHGRYQNLEDFLMRLTSANKKSLEALIRAGALDAFGNRLSLDYNVEAMLDFAKLSRQDHLSPMDTLFKSSPISRKLTLSSRPSSALYQQLSYEKEYLGLYISSHPLDAYKNRLHKLGVTLIKDIASPEINSKNKIRVLAIVSTAKYIRTKKGELMLFATVEDATGKIEIIVFPRLLQSDNALWKEDAILCIDGTLSPKDEDLKILAEKAQLVTDEKISLWLKQEDSNSNFFITVPPALSKKSLLVLKEIAAQHPGNVPLYLRLNKDPATIIKTKMKVAVTSSFEERIYNALLNF